MQYIKEDENGDPVFSMTEMEIDAVMGSMLYMNSQAKESFILSRVGLGKEQIRALWEDLRDALLCEDADEEDEDMALSVETDEADDDEFVFALSDEKIIAIYKSFIAAMDFIDDWEYPALTGVTKVEGQEIKKGFERELEKRAHTRQQSPQQAQS